MAGIQGQPAPKPKQVPNPVPAKEQELDFSDLLADEPPKSMATPTNTSILPNTEQNINTLFGTESPTMSTVGGVVGDAIAGAKFGARFGPLGAAAGAMLGASAETIYRQTLESKLFGNNDDSSIADKFRGIGWEGIKQGIYSGVGTGVGSIIGKGAKAIVDSRVGSRIKEYAESIAYPIINNAKQASDKIMGPVYKKFIESLPDRTTQESGDQVKKLLNDSISIKYKGFKDAYEALDEVATQIPLKDESRIGLINKLKNMTTKGVDKIYSKEWSPLIDDILAANDGIELKSVLGKIQGKIDNAFNPNGAGKDMGHSLVRLKNEVEDFYEDQIKNLAIDVQNGKAGQQEMQFITKIMDQRGIVEAHPEKYAKSLANDYLAKIKEVTTGYKGLKLMLEDVSEQAKIRVGRKGPTAILNTLNEIPSEMLIKKMFDSNNAAALTKMKQETPEIFNEVVNSRLNSMVIDSFPTRKFTLDQWHNFNVKIQKLHKTAAGKLFLDEKDVKALNNLLDPTSKSGKQLQFLDTKSREMRGKIENWMKEILLATESYKAGGPLIEDKLINNKVTRGIGRVGISTGKQLTGKTITNTLVDTFGNMK